MTWPTDDLATTEMDSDADSPLLMRPQLLAAVNKIKAMLGFSPAASGAVTGSGLTQATGRLLGRSTVGAGAIEELNVGSGLAIGAGILNLNISASHVTTALGCDPRDTGVFGLGSDQLLTTSTFGLGLANNATYSAASLQAVSPYFDGTTVSSYTFLAVSAGTWRYKGPTMNPVAGKYPVGQFQRIS